MVGIVPWVLSNPDVGWVVLILYLMWEIRGPKGAIHGLKIKIENAMVIVRALARVHDDIDTDDVDNYLNGGKEPNDFITDEKREREERIKQKGDD